MGDMHTSACLHCHRIPPGLTRVQGKSLVPLKRAQVSVQYLGDKLL